MEQSIDTLFDILFDTTARIDERDDAAIYLGQCHSTEVLNKLANFGNCANENMIILASVGESIGEIRVALNSFDFALISKLAPIAKKEALGIIKGKNQNGLPNINNKA